MGSVVRAMLLSDSHGWVDQRILGQLAGCDLVVHAGDIGAAQVLRQLRRRASRVLAVRGNNDVPSRWPPGEHGVLARLPGELRVSLPGGDLVVVHGDRAGPVATRHQRLRMLYEDARAVVYGHSHRLVCDRDARPWVLNPGACGRSRTFGGPSCLILEAAAAAWTVREYRFPPVLRG